MSNATEEIKRNQIIHTERVMEQKKRAKAEQKAQEVKRAMHNNTSIIGQFRNPMNR